MRRIIDGRMYNTDTARFLGEWENMKNATDFNYYFERLYRKKTGEFFIHTWDPLHGDFVRKMTEDEAKMWMEEKGKVETYIEIFGEPED